jgi:Tol biopolymer transport system component
VSRSHTSFAGLSRYPLDESYPPQGVFGVTLDVSRPVGLRGVTWPDWSPDGSQSVYVASVAGHATLRVINPDGSNDRPLTAPAANETDADPAWSPDGSTVAFVRKGLAPDSSVTSVHGYVVDRDGANEGQVAAVLPVGGVHPTWSADGLHLAYSGGGGTYVVNVDGSGFRLVSTQPTHPAQWRP